MKNERGFTLLELVVAVGLFLILVGIAIPSFQALRLSAALDRASEGVAATLQKARWQAITTGSTRTVVLPSSTRVEVRNAGGAVVSSIDVSKDAVSLGASTVPFTFDGRGFVTSGVSVTVTATSKVGTRSVTVSPLGLVR